MGDDLIKMHMQRADPLQEYQKTRWQKFVDRATVAVFLLVCFTLIHACDGGSDNDCERGDAAQISECD